MICSFNIALSLSNIHEKVGKVYASVSSQGRFHSSLFVMNKTGNKFRFRTNKPRQTYIESETHKDEGEPEEIAIQRKGFSSEYLNLARRFKIKVLPDRSLQRIGNISKERQNQSKEEPLRIRTQFARVKNRYRWQSPLQQLQRKPQSMSLNERSQQSTYRSNKHTFFRLNNKNTIYNQTFMKVNIDRQPRLLQQQEMILLKIEERDSSLMNLGNHSKKLFSIKQSLQRKELNLKQTIKQIKLYILREDGSSIARIDRSFQGEELRKQIKKLIIMQRIVLISIISNIVSNKLEELLEESTRSIEIILGFWFQIISNTYNQHLYKLQIQIQSDIKDLMNTLSQAKLMTKSNIKLLLETILQKIPILYKYGRHLYNKISFLIGMSEEMSINRTFYELLTLFANYLTDFEKKSNLNIDFISFFATCPSPYILKAATKPYSLVVDLDETLLFSKTQKNKLQTFYRPGCYQFINDLSKHYQIIVFTTSVQSYAKEVTKNFKNIDYFLYRQHAVRVKNGFVKDLSRLGRDLNKIIILDDLSNNFKLQKENGVKIKAWHGEEDDRELERIKEILIKIVFNKNDDIKSQLNSFRQQIEKKKVVIAPIPIPAPNEN